MNIIYYLLPMFFSINETFFLLPYLSIPDLDSFNISLSYEYRSMQTFQTCCRVYSQSLISELL